MVGQSQRLMSYEWKSHQQIPTPASVNYTGCRHAVRQNDL